MSVVFLLLSLVIAFSAAIGFVPALPFNTRKRTPCFLGVCIPILLGPLVVPVDAPFVRFLAAVSSLLIWMKLYDLHLDAERVSRLDRRPLLAFLLPAWGSMVFRKLENEPRPTRRDNWIRLALGFAGLSAGVAVLSWLFRFDWSGHAFVVEHSSKAVCLLVALSPLGWTAMSIWRLAGGRARDFLDAPLVARTPADFWRRYNRPVQQFFFEDVFKRVGGFRSPARATLITFAISGLVHEYVFGIATGRVRGYQMAFFMIHGCAVAATMRVRPRGWQAVPWIAATLVFNLVASVFFFANLDDVVPFYSRGLPEWLKRW